MAKPDPAATTPRELLPKVHPELLGDLRPFLRHPLSPQRWRAWKDEIITELHERADRNGSTPEEELIWATSAAVQIAQCEGREEEPRFHAEWVTWYRRRIQNLVTADLLGLDWRKRERHDAEDLATPTEQPEHPATVRRVEARSELDALWKQVTDTERDFLEQLMELVGDGWDVKAARLEAGRRTGRNSNAVRQLVHRMKNRRNVSPFSAD